MAVHLVAEAQDDRTAVGADDLSVGAAGSCRTVRQQSQRRWYYVGSICTSGIGSVMGHSRSKAGPGRAPAIRCSKRTTLGVGLR